MVAKINADKKSIIMSKEEATMEAIKGTVKPLICVTPNPNT